MSSRFNFVARPLEEDAIVYISKYDKNSAPGIRKKVIATLKAAESMGYRTRNLNEAHTGELRFRHIFREVIAANEKYVLVRSFTESNIFLMPALLFARLQGKVVIVDIPTPNKVAAREIWHQALPLKDRLYRVCLLYCGGPYSVWPASRIIQYADESLWFSLGNKNKTLKLGNGIDPDQVPLRKTVPRWPAARLRLVAVATVSHWHGYDRIIRAVHEWVNDPAAPYGVQLTIIGDGAALNDLKSLVRDLDVEQFVSFTGMLDQIALNEHIANSHLAVSSLGLHRNGLTESSQLKAREYCAAGIPFVASGSDPDFPNDVPFRIEVSLSEDTEDLKNVFRSFGTLLSQSTPEQMRKYAETHLTYLSKLKKLGILEYT